VVEGNLSFTLKANPLPCRLQSDDLENPLPVQFYPLCRKTDLFSILSELIIVFFIYSGLVYDMQRYNNFMRDANVLRKSYRK
jgi:hypothetical protein